MRSNLAVRSSCFLSVTYMVPGTNYGSDCSGSKILFGDSFVAKVEETSELDLVNLVCLVENLNDCDN